MSGCKDIQKELEAFLSGETDKVKISEIMGTSLLKHQQILVLELLG